MLRMSCGLRRGAVFAAILVVLVALGARVPDAAADTPTDVVGRFQDAALSVWTDAESLSPSQRFQRLEEPVRAAFDLETMIRIATGAAWKSATPAEQQTLIDAFTRYSVASWASRFDSYNGQRFEMVGSRPGPSGRVIVETRIVPRSGDTVALDYVLDDASGSSRIVDVVAKGVSELAKLRSDYRSTLRNEGPAGLARAIDGLAASLLAD
jgi:phospholipid transport system substrate-binding protein